MYKFWLETEEGYIFGEGSFELLKGIREKGTLTASAETLKMSYRHAWGMIKQIEKKLRHPILTTFKGGKDGGGGARLTKNGRELIDTFLKYKKAVDKAILITYKNE
jgi:molybdate transport repressor ModE-like protein